MGKYEVSDEMPESGATRNLDAEDMAEADAAIADGKVRHIPANAVNEASVKAIKRYLSKEGWGCKVTLSGGKIHWRVVAKKEMTPEHKATLQAALQKARDEAKAKRVATEQANNGATSETPTPEAPKDHPPVTSGGGKRKA